jgi:hypothetical protein
MEAARDVMERLDRLDMHFVDVAARLERVGVQQFAEAFDESINAIKQNIARSTRLRLVRRPPLYATSAAQ